MNREIKFRAWDERHLTHSYTLEEEVKPGHFLQHYITVYHNHYSQSGYVLRKVKQHPYSNKRGYVPEHRLIMEIKMGRTLVPRKELVHHVNGIRDDNRLENIRLSNPKDHAVGHIGERNPNGRFACDSKEFQEKKFRLHDADRNITQTYTLSELIGKTYRRGKFEYRGEFTGLKDNNGKEIYEGDICTIVAEDGNINSLIVEYGIARRDMASGWTVDIPCFYWKVINAGGFKAFPIVENFEGKHDLESMVVIGNIYENPELLEEK